MVVFVGIGLDDKAMTLGPENAALTQAQRITDGINCSSFQDWYARGEEFAQRQDYLKALRCFEEAAVLCPDHPDVLVYQAVCWVHLNHPQKALAVTDGLLSQVPDHSQGWLFRGVALHRLGQYGEAYVCYDRALGKTPRVGVIQRLKHFWGRFRATHGAGA